MRVTSLALGLVWGALASAAFGANELTPSAFGYKNYDVKFEGGTLASYYDLISGVDSQLQVVFSNDAEDVQMPALELRGVNYYMLHELPERLIDGVDVEDQMGFWDRSKEQEQPPITYTVRVDPEATKQQTFDLDFPGGSLGSFVEALREAAGANVVLGPKAAAVEMPAVTLRDAYVHNVMVTLPSELTVPSELGERVSMHAIWKHTEPEKNQGLLYFLRVESPDDDGPPAMRVRHWSLGGIVERGGISAEDVLGAIESQREFFRGELRVGYHEPTRVLVVRAPGFVLDEVDGLLDQIASSAHAMEQARNRPGR